MTRPGLDQQWPQILSLTLALALLAPSAGFSQDNASNGAEKDSTKEMIGPVLPGGEPVAQPSSDKRSSLLNWETGAGRSYLIPSAEILAYIFLLNLYDRHFSEPTELYKTNGDTIWKHLTDSKWVIDDDQFNVN